MISKKIILFILIGLIGSLFLPIVFNNIPFPFSSFYFYCIGFVLYIIFTDVKILFSKFVLCSYFFIILYSIGIKTIWSDRIVGLNEIITFNWLKLDIMPLFFSSLLLSYFIKKKDSVIFNKMIAFFYISLLITSITSIIGFFIFPEAARISAGGRHLSEYSGVVLFVDKFGVASYSFFSSLTFLIPIIILLFKKKIFHIFNSRLHILIWFIITSFAIIKSQFTSSLIFLLFFSYLSYILDKLSKAKLIFLIFFFIVLLIIPRSFYASLFYDLSTIFDSQIYSSRIYDLGKTIEDMDIDRQAESHIGRRLGRTPLLLESIFRNPIIGGGLNTNHIFFLDRLSMFGLVGLLPWIFLLYLHIKYMKINISKEYYPYYALSIFEFILLGLVKNSGFSQVIITVFFIIPSTFIFIENKEKKIKLVEVNNVQG